MLRNIRRTVAVGASMAIVFGGAVAGPATAADPLTAGTPVARVGSTVIDLATVDRWAEAFEVSSAGSRAVNRARTRYRRCHAEVTSGTADTPCRKRIAAGRRAALWTVVTVHALVLEARRLDLRLTSPSLARGELRDVVSLRGADRAILDRAIAAEQALTRHAVALLPPPSEAALRRAWERMRESHWFTERLVRAEVLELRSRADAETALAALRAGESFVTVGARLTAPGAGTFHGDNQLFAEEWTGDPNPSVVSRAVFSAPLDELRGPIPAGARRGFYVLRVTEIVSERRRVPLPQVREEVLAEVRWRQESRAIMEVSRTALAHWRPGTTCDRRVAVRRACGRVVDDVSR